MVNIKLIMCMVLNSRTNSCLCQWPRESDILSYFVEYCKLITNNFQRPKLKTTPLESYLLIRITLENTKLYSNLCTLAQLL